MLGQPARGGVGLDRDEAQRLTSIVERDPGRDLDPVLAPALGVVEHLAVERRARRDRRSHVRHRRAIGVRPLQDAARRVPAHLVEGVPGPDRERRVDPLDANVEVGDHHRVVGQVRDLCQARELALVEPLTGDVGHDPAPADHRALGVALGPDHVAAPPNAALGEADAILDDALGGLRGRHQPREVVRFDACAQRLERGLDLAWRVA